MDRGFDRAAAAHFGVGYAPRGWENLLKKLRGKGFTEPELAASGLVSQGRNGHYDRFRGRLMWPIRDLTGDVVGFGRSEEHTSELQSRGHLVCRLLLEKKKAMNT